MVLWEHVDCEANVCQEVKKEIFGHKICLDGQSLRGVAFNLGLFPILKGPQYKVNSKLCLSSDKKKNWVILDLIHNDYEVNKWPKNITRLFGKV
jgi:hypothetical protein